MKDHLKRVIIVLTCRIHATAARDRATLFFAIFNFFFVFFVFLFGVGVFKKWVRTFESAFSTFFTFFFKNGAKRTNESEGNVLGLGTAIGRHRVAAKKSPQRAGVSCVRAVGVVTLFRNGKDLPPVREQHAAATRAS